jgi:hypothetical protein
VQQSYVLGLALLSLAGWQVLKSKMRSFNAESQYILNLFMKPTLLVLKHGMISIFNGGSIEILASGMCALCQVDDVITKLLT